jgi:hypothetical protein
MIIFVEINTWHLPYQSETPKSAWEAAIYFQQMVLSGK